jgi:hypothetical protein
MRKANLLIGAAATAILQCSAPEAFAQVPAEARKAFTEICGFSSSVRDPLIDEAEREQFNVRRVEFVGSTYTRGRDLFKRARSVNEGDIFTRHNLGIALKQLSKMKQLHPVSMDDVEVRLDRPHRSIDILFCVKQKPRK